jgi:hypothetical protein
MGTANPAFNLISSENVEGTNVYDPSGNKIGSLVARWQLFFPELRHAQEKEGCFGRALLLAAGPCALSPMHQLARQAKDVVIGGEEHQAA